MKEQIIQNINNPEMLEVLFRKDKSAFMRDFDDAASGVESDLIKFWRIRLESGEQTKKPVAYKNGLLAIAVISVITALLARLPLVLKGIEPEDYYVRNLPVIIFAGLSVWHFIKNKLTGWKNILSITLPFLILAVFINLLPGEFTDTTILALIHAPFYMGFIMALAYVSFNYKNTDKVSGLIRYCGELIIMSGLLAITGSILSGLTISLFAIIGMQIGQFYMENIAIIGVAVIPVIAAWLIDLYPGITEKIAPVIARIFTPLVLLSAVIYLVAIAVSGISLAENREFLLIFNIMLLCVMAIIVFSLSEIDKSDVRKLHIILLFLLAVVTLVIDLFALAAIVSRLTEGFTPNRTVVLVSNILVLVNLLLVLPGLFVAGFRGKPVDPVERMICRYLPVYFIYAVIVIFCFPWIFNSLN